MGWLTFPSVRSRISFSKMGFFTAPMSHACTSNSRQVRVLGLPFLSFVGGTFSSSILSREVSETSIGGRPKGFLFSPGCGGLKLAREFGCILCWACLWLIRILALILAKLHRLQVILCTFMGFCQEWSSFWGSSDRQSPIARRLPRSPYTLACLKSLGKMRRPTYGELPFLPTQFAYPIAMMVYEPMVRLIWAAFRLLIVPHSLSLRPFPLEKVASSPWVVSHTIPENPQIGKLLNATWALGCIDVFTTGTRGELIYSAGTKGAAWSSSPLARRHAG